MGFLVILPIAALSIWFIVVTLRRLRRTRPDGRWWRAVALHGVVGLALGIWFAFFLEFQPSPNFRIAGFPVPVFISHLQDDVWTDEPLPMLVRIGARITNLIFGVTLSLIPVALVNFLRELKEHFGPLPPKPN